MTNGHASFDTIASRIRKGVAWKAGSQISLQITRMVVALVLARLLAPHDWGLAAMVLVCSGFVIVFTDSALGTALIQRRDLSDADRSTVFWTSACIGVLLAVGGLLLAGPLARFFGEPEVRPMLAVLSVSYFVTALGTTHLALLVRDMHFGRLEVRQIVATIVGASTGITVAVAGFGAWAIVWQQVAEAITSTLLLWYLAKWHPSLTVSVASLRRLGGFAGNVFGENLLYQAGRNLNNLLIGRFLGAAALGTYSLATNVILVPFARIAGPLQQVFFPAFSRMTEDRERIADVWIRATRLVACVSIPALAGLIVVAPDFVAVALGAKWSEAVPVIQILAVAGMIHSIQTLSGEVLLAVGRAGWLLRFTLLSFVSAVVAFVVGVHWGIVGVATSYVVATALVEPVRTWLASRALGISPWRFFAALSGVAQATALMALVLLITRAALVAAGLQPFPRLVVLVLAGGAAYVVGCFWRAPELFRELRRVLRRGRPIAAAAVPAEPVDARL